VAGVIGVALLIFVVSDFFGSNSGSSSQARKYYELATIGDESVSYQEFDARIQNLAEIYRLSGTQEITEELSETMRSQIWDQLIREKILGKEYRKLGLEVSVDELDAMVLGDNKHPIVMQLFSDPQTGMFNESYLVNFLKSTETDPTANSYWLFFEDEIISDRLNTKYNNMVSMGLYVTKFQTEFEQSLSTRVVDFSYTGKPFTAIADSLVTVTKDEIKKYYNARKEDFKRSAVRSFDYITYDIKPSEEDFQDALTWITKTAEEFAIDAEPEQFINLTSDNRYVGFYQTISQVSENLREFVLEGSKNSIFGPYLEDNTYKVARILDVAQRSDSVRARHILLTPNEGRTMEMARKEADSLLLVIAQNKNFDILALMLSDDQGSAQTGGDLGWFSEGMMVIPFNDACFSHNKGDIVTAETNFGVHIIEILDQSPKVTKYNIGIIDRVVTAGSGTIQKIYGEASQFAGNNPDLEKFNQTISEKGMTKKIATNISPDQKDLTGITNARYIIMSLFETEVGDVILDNNQQAVFELGDQYVVGYCTKIQEEGYASLSDVEDDIRYKLINNKKADILAAEFTTKMKESKSLETITMEMGLLLEESTGISFNSFMLQGTAGIEPALISAATVAEDGKLSGPVKGTNGVYILSVNMSQSNNPEDLAAVKDRLSAMLQIRASYEIFEALRKETPIVDKRYKFY